MFSMVYKKIKTSVLKLFETKKGLRDILREGIAPAGLHREKFQTLPRSNPNFSGNDPTAYMRTEQSLNEVLLG